MNFPSLSSSAIQTIIFLIIGVILFTVGLKTIAGVNTVVV